MTEDDIKQALRERPKSLLARSNAAEWIAGAALRVRGRRPSTSEALDIVGRLVGEGFLIPVHTNAEGRITQVRVVGTWPSWKPSGSRAQQLYVTFGGTLTRDAAQACPDRDYEWYGLAEWKRQGGYYADALRPASRAS